MKRLLLSFIAFAFFLSLAHAQNALSYKDIQVAEVIDGETLELANGERVKLIGVDCPTAETLDGLKATLFLKVIAEGKKITLEFDEKKKDNDGRLLAYAYISAGTGCSACLPRWAYGKIFENNLNIFLNATILKAGYVSSATVSPNVKYADLFTSLYEEAREKKKGLWKNP